MKKLILALLLLCFISLTFVGCGETYTQDDIDRAYDKGHAEGYDTGYNKGHAEGYDAGYEKGYADALAETEIAEEERGEEEKQVVETTDTQIIKEWTGDGIKKTEPFLISKQPWAISWVCNMSGSYGGIFSIMVYTTKNELVALVANTTQSSSDVSYIYETGTFYLDIGGYDANWAIQVVQFP